MQMPMSKTQHRNALPDGFELQEYHIDSIIGHGGFGITYLAKDTHLDQWVAIKEYLPNGLAVRDGISTVYPKSSSDEEAFEWGLQRFIIEARTLAQFKHHNIVKVLRFFETHHTAYMVMEYEDGESLSERLKRGTIDEDVLLKILMPLLDGLEAVHATGFLHRDIKPGNIFLRSNDSPVLLDFGAARLAMGEKSTSLTSIVTPGYAPFEQYDSRSVQGAWTDIYAMGGVLYYAVSGQIPHEVVGRLKQDTMPRAVEVGEGRYSKNLLRAIDWALALDEEARPQSIREWREAILAPPLDILPKPHYDNRKEPIEFWVPSLWSVLFVLLLIPIGYFAYEEYKKPGYLASLMTHQPREHITEVDVRHFIGNYFAANEQADIEALLALYSESVDYYSWGLVRKSNIDSDKKEFFQQWPNVHYTLVSPISIQNTNTENEKTVLFEITFTTHNPNPFRGPNTITGRARHEWTLRWTPDTGVLIVREKQKVFSRKRDYDEKP
jgi:serine/threonine protein kinase